MPTIFKDLSKKTFLKTIGYFLIFFFALIGLIFSFVFLGMQFDWFTVQGSIKERNQFFETPEEKSAKEVHLEAQAVQALCNSDRSCIWKKTQEWETVKAGLVKDKDVINAVSKITGVKPRLIAATVVPEQLRFFTSEREVYKKYFEPLKILGTMSQFSLGVSGIKPKTANQIEIYAASSTSSFYPGENLGPLLSYGKEPHDETQFKRLTDAHNHYYAFLYTAIFLQEISANWAHNGVNISNNTGVLITLFNLGFEKSVPKTDPKVGGATITIDETNYAYGELGELFYQSDELADVFPK